MTDRRLPPALENLWFDTKDGNGSPFEALDVEDLLDWLYGTTPANKYGAPFSGLVQRAWERFVRMARQGQPDTEVNMFIAALRIELGMEP